MNHRHEHGWGPPWRHAGRRRPPGAPCPPTPPAPPWFENFAGRPRRAERGEVRFLILDALSEQPRHGYEIITAIEERSAGAYRPSPGTVYPTLQMLEDMGLVRCKDEGKKKVYELTDEGREELDAHRDVIEDAYERWQGDTMHPRDVAKVTRRLERMMRLLARSFRRGRVNVAKRRQVEKIIADAIERIEEVLK